MGKTPIEWYDRYTDTRERKVFTFHEHGIPGLRMFGYHNTSHALAPLERHYHKNCFEFTYLVQGNLCFSVDGSSYPLSGGDLYITFPNELHDTGNAPMSLHQMYWFQLECNHPDDFLYMAPEAARYVIDQLYQLPCRIIKMQGNEAKLLAEIFTNIASGTELGRIQSGCMLGALLCQILKRSDLSAVHITPDIARATDYILQNIEQEFTMDDLARISLLSVSRFKQKFKSQIGTSPRGYINYHKIEQAKRMLSNGMSITETAMELSFSSSNYFSVVFRRYTSVSPTEYLEGLACQQEP